MNINNYFYKINISKHCLFVKQKINYVYLFDKETIRNANISKIYAVKKIFKNDTIRVWKRTWQNKNGYKLL